MVVELALVARHRHGGIKLQACSMTRTELTRAITQRFGLTQHERATCLLTHLHAAAAQCTPEPIMRIARHGSAHLAARLRWFAAFAYPHRFDTLAKCHGVARGDDGGHVLVEVGEEVEPRNVVMRHGGRHRMLPDVTPGWSAL